MPHLFVRARGLVVAAAIAVLTLSGAVSGAARAAPTPSSPPPLGLGVQTFSMWRDWDDHAALMDDAVAAGTKWLRIDIGWCSLEENGPGVVSAWYQSRLDTVVTDANARGLHLLLTLTCAPTWSTATGTIEGYPTDPAQYQRVAGYLAARYRGRVAAWEIWNEPNCVGGGCPNGTAAAYLPILRAGYLGVRAGSPSATVVSGGISGADVGWVRQLLRLGGADYLDALALHPYLTPASAPPTTRAVAGYTNPYRITNIPAIERLLVGYGHPQTPVWLTEFGWTTGRTPGSPYDGVTPAMQASYLNIAVRFVRSHYPYVAMAFWYMLRDRDDSSGYEDGFGLLTVGGRAKPSFATFRMLNRDLAG